MRKGTGFVQAYTTRTAVDADHRVVIATHVTNLAPDAPHLPDLLAEVHENLGVTPREVSADAGFDSDASLDAIEQAGAVSPTA